MTPLARIVVIGTEPLLAPVDTDGVALAAMLAGLGAPPANRVVVEEDDSAVESMLASGAAVTVVIAGAGAAADVIRRVVARATGTRLVPSAQRPEGATAWATADGQPAWTLESERGAFVVIPRGAELRGPVEQELARLVQSRVGGGHTAIRVLKTVGVPAAEVKERLAGLGVKEGDVVVTAVPSAGEVWVRLRARGATARAAGDVLAAIESAAAAALGDDCYGRDGDSLELVVGRLLGERGLTLSVAESCTGGLLGHRLTSIAGSSAYFERGVVVYSNRAKEELLGVPDGVLRAHGAVSAACAEAMARGIVERAGSPCGLAVTGIAGPDGGSPAKPVGTVFIGLAMAGRVESRRFLFPGDRASVKWQSSQMALDMLRRRLLEVRE